MLVTSVTSKYQATIPLEARNLLGLKAGDKVIFELNKTAKTATIKKYTGNDKLSENLQKNSLSEDWLSTKDKSAFSNW
ncbi:MAG: AbrB/MazE/SpoVT family DNA-binding domain-containing protein [Rickettsiales bacterium]|nr:AbrB/MazE/SpoVT family DNA-binding domain-containing protein [Rickettsiales bacterium]